MKKLGLHLLAVVPLVGSLALAASMNPAPPSSSPQDEAAAPAAKEEPQPETEASEPAAEEAKPKGAKTVEGALPTEWAAAMPWR